MYSAFTQPNIFNLIFYIEERKYTSALILVRSIIICISVMRNASYFLSSIIGDAKIKVPDVIAKLVLYYKYKLTSYTSFQAL